MKHTIFLNPDNYIEIHVNGDVTLDDVNHLGQQVVNYITTLEEKDLLVNILVDYTGGENTEELAVTTAKFIASNISFHKIAGFSANEATAKIAKDVAKAANVEDRMRLFKTRAEAETWLSEDL